MLKNWQTVLMGAALLVALAMAGGCKQTEGDRCQLDSDCEDGLSCCYLDSQKSKGICKPKDRCEATSVDSGVKMDGGKVDLTVTKDTSAPDQAVTTPDQTVATPDQMTAPDKSMVVDSMMSKE